MPDRLNDGTRPRGTRVTAGVFALFERLNPTAPIEYDSATNGNYITTSTGTTYWTPSTLDQEMEAAVAAEGDTTC